MHSAMTSFIAQITQKQVLDSISRNVDQNGSVTSGILLIVGIIVVIVLVLYLGSAKRNVGPVTARGVKVLHHHGKLMKEMNKTLGIRPADAKKLKTLAIERNLQSPLTLLLCPSLLKKPRKPAEPARKAA